MLIVPGSQQWGFRYSNQTGGSATPGTSVVPGATNAEGAWTQVAAAASITADIYWCRLIVSDGFTNAQVKNHYLDLGIDPAGGTSYAQWLGDLICGTSLTWGVGAAGRAFEFPCFIPSGSAIAVRVQGSNGTAGTVRVQATFWGKPKRPDAVLRAMRSETIGAAGSTAGTTYAVGNASWGAWTSLGTLANAARWLQLGIDCNSVAAQGTMHLAELGVGVSGTVRTLGRVQYTLGTAGRTHRVMHCPCSVDAGAELFARGYATTTVQGTWSAIVAAFGG